MHFLQTTLPIGNINIRNRVFLAPMSGVTDLPFRKLAWEYGAGLVFSEMVASQELCKSNDESLLRLRGDGLGVHAVQLAGRECYWMAEAARMAQAAGADIIDINMGCPAKKVIDGYSGAALMRDEPLALSMIEAVVKAVTIPVTLKMRLGWDHETMNAPLIAKEAEKRGIQMVTIHGRTRVQFYNGHADWDAIKKIRDVISIPLVANGDIATEKDAQDVVNRTGADCIMVGRASYGQPWLCGQLMGMEPPKDILNYIIQHYQAIIAHYGEKTGVRHARKHLDWYLNLHAKDSYTQEERKYILTQTNVEHVIQTLKDIFSRQQNVLTKTSQ